MSPRNPRKNKHNDPKWWESRLKRAGCAVHRGERPRDESHVGNGEELQGIEEQNSKLRKCAEGSDNAGDTTQFDKHLIYLWESPGFLVPSHTTYLHYVAWCFALGITPASELWYREIATIPKRKERP